MKRKLHTIKTFLVLNIFLCALWANAQTTVKGAIKNAKGKPVSGASISIKDSYDGTTADSIGAFSFTTYDKGEQLLQITSVGYRPYEQKITLTGSALNLNITMKEEVTELTAVILTAGTFEASDRKRSVAVLEPLDIVTTASANGDVTGAFKTLPGAQQVGESEGLFVRGGTAAETKTFIDGTLVNNFFFTSVPNISQFSRFSPFLFKGSVFSVGGYSALYGQALSSALMLESIDLPDRNSANIGLSLLGVDLGFQQLTKNKNASYGASVGYTNLTPAFAIIKQKQDYAHSPESINTEFNFRIKTSKTGIIKYYGYYNNYKMAFTVNSIDTLGLLDKFSLKNSNTYHNLSWKENLKNKWKIQAGASYSVNEDDINSGLQSQSKRDVTLPGLEFKQFTVKNNGIYINGKLVLEKKFTGMNAIRFGTEYNYSNLTVDYYNYQLQKFPSTVKDHIVSTFAEGDIFLTSALGAKVGMRMEHSSLLGKTNIAPRVSIAYKFSPLTQGVLSYGVFFQNPESRYLPTPAGIDFMKATHYIAQLQKVVSGRSFRTEVFYKKYESLIKTGVVNGKETAVNNNGYGHAQGIEFFWRDKKSVPGLDYWISYSFLDTKRDFNNFPYAIQPSFAAKHTASFVVKRFVQPLKMNINLAYNFSSPRPYYNIYFDGTSYKFRDMGKVDPYHNVSFAINYLPFIGKKNPKSYTVYVFHVSNIFNLKQTYGYQYSYNGMRKEAIVPTSRMFVYIGAFISIGTDRSDEVINNTLK